jgi:hypothetical protein
MPLSRGTNGSSYLSALTHQGLPVGCVMKLDSLKKTSTSVGGPGRLMQWQQQQQQQYPLVDPRGGGHNGYLQQQFP